MTSCHETADTQLTTRVETDTFLVALAGQPNMGKSTLFNLLTGLNQHVGNWPGKTIERRAGNFKYQDHSIRLVDLPGTYSLTANSPEEVIARDFIIREQPDLVIAVVSAANLECSLYLVSELICLPAPLIVALNMMDVAEQEGMQVDAHILEAALGVPVIPMIASRTIGVTELLQTANDLLDRKIISKAHIPEIRADHRSVLDEVVELIRTNVPSIYPVDWAALKLLEGDKELLAAVQADMPAASWRAVQGILKAHEDAFLAIASGRYDWIERMVRVAIRRPRLGQISVTERIDRYATHPVWGLVSLAGILGLVFWLTFTLGTPVQGWLSSAILRPLAGVIAGLLSGAPAWLSSFFVDGLLGGVGAVLTFLPIMAVFFACFGVLEDTGYMSRAAFVMDNFMHWMGLHGKSFLPLFLGFGCNVPAVLGTRVVDSKPARMVTILIAPFIPCTARMAVLAFIAPAFFGQGATLVSWALILFSLVILVLTGALLNRTIFKGERSVFIMEMPIYHLPNRRTIGMLVWQRSLSFIKKAGTAILVMSLVIWVLSHLPGGDLQSSFLARAGQWIEPVGRWMGMDWRLTVAILTSFLAKENSIATLGVLFGGSQSGGLAQTLAATYSPATGLAFLAVSLLFVPCAATVAVIRQETGSWGWTLLNIGFMLVISIVVGIAVFASATALGL